MMNLENAPWHEGRQTTDDEIAAALHELKLSPNVGCTDIAKRLADVTQRIVEATDDNARHDLAVERAALILLRRELEGEEKDEPTSTHVADAPENPHYASILYLIPPPIVHKAGARERETRNMGSGSEETGAMPKPVEDEGQGSVSSAA